MGVSTKAITFIGREFRNEQEGMEYFKSKVHMTEDDLDEMGPRLQYWLEVRQDKGFPDCGLYSIWSGEENCGYYIGYNVYDSNPAKMQAKIAKSAQLWQDMFKEEPKLIQAVLFS